MEGDSKPIMETLQERNSSPDWKLTPVLEEINSIASNFTCIFLWINREANSAADYLAKWAARSNFSGFTVIGDLLTHVGDIIFSKLI